MFNPVKSYFFVVDNGKQLKYYHVAQDDNLREVSNASNSHLVFNEM